MLLLLAESLVVVQGPLHQLTIPREVATNGITVRAVTERVSGTTTEGVVRALPLAEVAREAALVEVSLDVQALHELELDVTLAVEVVVLLQLVVLILCLHHVTLVVSVVVTREVSAILVVDRGDGHVVVGRDEIIRESSLAIGQGTRTRQTDTQAVVDAALLELETEAVTLHPVVAGDTLTIQVGVRSTIVDLLVELE